MIGGMLQQHGADPQLDLHWIDREESGYETQQLGGAVGGEAIPVFTEVGEQRIVTAQHLRCGGLRCGEGGEGVDRRRCSGVQ